MLTDITIVCRSGNLIHGFKKIDGDPSKFPLLYIPGLSGTAEEGSSFISNLEGSGHLTFSMRGRGKSSTPNDGYSVDDHADDIEDIICDLGLKNFVLHGYSIATLYVLRAAQKYNRQPSAFILCDYPACEKKLAHDWVDTFSKMTISGKSVLENISIETLAKIQINSNNRNSVEVLAGIKCPVIIIAGSNSVVFPPSLLKEADREDYIKNLDDVKMHLIEGGGHFLRDTHRNEYVQIIKNFLGSLENRDSSFKREKR